MKLCESVSPLILQVSKCEYTKGKEVKERLKMRKSCQNFWLIIANIEKVPKFERQQVNSSCITAHFCSNKTLIAYLSLFSAIKKKVD